MESSSTSSIKDSSFDKVESNITLNSPSRRKMVTRPRPKVSVKTLIEVEKCRTSICDGSSQRIQVLNSN